jgi:hypothetical protein
VLKHQSRSLHVEIDTMRTRRQQAFLEMTSAPFIEAVSRPNVIAVTPPGTGPTALGRRPNLADRKAGESAIGRYLEAMASLMTPSKQP